MRLIPIRTLPKVLAVVAGSLLTLGAHAADSFWQAVRTLEAWAPLDEVKVGRTLTAAMQRVPGSPPGFRSGQVRFTDGFMIEDLVFTPRQGNAAATFTVSLPASEARGEFCIGRGDVSAQYGAPSGFSTSNEGNAAFSHFEFERPKARVAVTFSDATNCLLSLTLTER